MKLLLQVTAAVMLTLAASAAHAGNVLVVLSDVDKLDLKDGKVYPTGFYINELMQPVKLLLDAGHQVTFVTPHGQVPVMDANSLNAMFFGGDEAMQAHRALMDKLAITSKEKSPVISLARVEQIGYDKFDAVYVPGGHAPMQDLLTSPALGRLFTDFHKKGKPTALVCHGPIALLSTLPDARSFTKQMAAANKATRPQWIYNGYRLTVFTNDEETQATKAQLNGGTMKFFPQTALEQAGAKFNGAQSWSANVVVDRELITGQNPASAVGVATELLARLGGSNTTAAPAR